MSRNGELRQRFLRGERLTAAQVQEEYGGSRSGLQWAIRTMKGDGYIFKSKKIDGNAQEYWLDLKKSKSNDNGVETGEPEAEAEQELDLTDDRPTVTKIRERFEAGEGLVASEIGEEYDVHPNTLSVTMAQMTKEGFVFEHSSDRTIHTNGKARTLKRHRVAAKHEPLPSEASNGRKKKSAVGFRIPAPQVDMLTEVILVHRIGDGEIQVGLLQNGHQWLLEVKSYVE